MTKSDDVWKRLITVSAVWFAFCYGLLVGAKKTFPYYHIDKLKKRVDGSYPTDAKYSHTVVERLDSNSILDLHFIHVNRNCHATLLCVADGPTVMIGCGPLTDSKIVLKYLSKLGINSIDKVIIPYYDRDFVGGLKPLIEHICVSEFLLGKRNLSIKKKTKIESILQHEKVRYPNVGTKIELSDEITLQKLGPTKTFNSDNTPTEGPNRCNSSVYKLVSPSFEVVLMGDAQIPAEKELLGSKYNLSADILKVGHHGHGPVNTLEFLDAVDPTIAIIDNAWPKEQRDDKVLECRSKLAHVDKIDIYETNSNGSIVIQDFGDKSEVQLSVFGANDT